MSTTRCEFNAANWIILNMILLCSMISCICICIILFGIWLLHGISATFHSCVDVRKSLFFKEIGVTKPLTNRQRIKISHVCKLFNNSIKLIRNNSITIKWDEKYINNFEIMQNVETKYEHQLKFGFQNRYCRHYDSKNFWLLMDY